MSFRCARFVSPDCGRWSRFWFAIKTYRTEAGGWHPDRRCGGRSL